MATIQMVAWFALGWFSYGAIKRGILILFGFAETIAACLFENDDRE